MKRIVAVLLAISLFTGAAALAERTEARADFIDRIISMAEELYIKADGKAQQAHYKGDIYLCKNFTTYLFRENRDDFRIAEYPNVELVIPDNLPKEECAPYGYGVEWKEVAAAEGNPFYEAASFRYDTNLSKEENWENAMDMMRQVERGDFFQMRANYYYGISPHSLIFIANYDPETQSVHWTDSNMNGKKIKDIRYGYVQYDAEKGIEWFAEAICRKGYGATIYRLRDDIVYANP